MDDFFMDYAAVRRSGNIVHRALWDTKPADRVTLAVQGNHVELLNIDGVSLAKVVKTSSGKMER